MEFRRRIGGEICKEMSKNLGNKRFLAYTLIVKNMRRLGMRDDEVKRTYSSNLFKDVQASDVDDIEPMVKFIERMSKVLSQYEKDIILEYKKEHENNENNDKEI